jgi:hypothetical protein
MLKGLQSTFNYECWAGETFDETTTYLIEGIVVPMSNKTGRWQVRATTDISPVAPDTPLWSVTSQANPTRVVLDDEAPNIRLIIPATTTEGFAPGNYVHEFEYEDVDGRVTKVFRGLFVVRAEITR